MNEDPKKRPPIDDDSYYGANAKLDYYRVKLNDALRGKNPRAFDKFLSEVSNVRRTDYSKSPEFIEGYDFKDALAPQELKEILGGDYGDYINTIKTIRDRGFADSKAKKLYGEKEMDQDVESLMYGKRFMTIPLMVSRDVTYRGPNRGPNGQETISDMYSYDPKNKKVNKITVKK
jgi:hypothetical protein